MNTKSIPANQVKQITQAAFDDYLGEFPPENWCGGVFEHFRCVEYWSYTETEQYGHRNGIYITKRIDVTDKTTWLKLSDFDGFKPLTEADDAIGIY